MLQHVLVRASILTLVLEPAQTLPILNRIYVLMDLAIRARIVRQLHSVREDRVSIKHLW